MIDHLAGPMYPGRERFRQHLIDWSPTRREVHCSNCRHCTVKPSGADIPDVVCARGYGKPLSMEQVIRPAQPRQFVPADRCSDFRCMSDTHGKECPEAAGG